MIIMVNPSVCKPDFFSVIKLEILQASNCSAYAPLG